MNIDPGFARCLGEAFAPRAIPFVPEMQPAREGLVDSRTLKGGGTAGIATVGTAGVDETPLGLQSLRRLYANWPDHEWPLYGHRVQPAAI